MNRSERRTYEAGLKSKPVELTPVPREEWPQSIRTDKRFAVWVSRKYLVQVFREEHAIRISVNRTTTKGIRWDDGLSWDELQQIKRDIGYGNVAAVEIYPADCAVVNVANMRHLWIPDTPLDIGWYTRS